MNQTCMNFPPTVTVLCTVAFICTISNTHSTLAFCKVSRLMTNLVFLASKWLTTPIRLFAMYIIGT